MEHRPNAYILVSPNPLIFEAQEVRRLDSRTYLIEHAWLTVCEPDKPNWKFFTAHATLHVDRSVAMVNANFRLFRIPLVIHAVRHGAGGPQPAAIRIPECPNSADTSLKGFVLGDGYYWAPKDWTDISLGAALSQPARLAAKRRIPREALGKCEISAKYFGVIDRGLPVAFLTGLPSNR